MKPARPLFGKWVARRRRRVIMRQRVPGQAGRSSPDGATMTPAPTQQQPTTGSERPRPSTRRPRDPGHADDPGDPMPPPGPTPGPLAVSPGPTAAFDARCRSRSRQRRSPAALRPRRRRRQRRRECRSAPRHADGRPGRRRRHATAGHVAPRACRRARPGSFINPDARAHDVRRCPPRPGRRCPRPIDGTARTETYRRRASPTAVLRADHDTYAGDLRVTRGRTRRLATRAAVGGKHPRPALRSTTSGARSNCVSVGDVVRAPELPPRRVAPRLFSWSFP